MVIARLVNQQTLDFNSFCEYLADGATVTSADCAAVLKQIETRLPFVLAFNSKVICSPEGLYDRFKAKANFKREKVDSNDSTEDSGHTDDTDGTDSSGSGTNQGTNNGGDNGGGGTLVDDPDGD